jgi:hypothetical protein
MFVPKERQNAMEAFLAVHVKQEAKNADMIS